MPTGEGFSMSVKVGDSIPSMKLMPGTADGPKEVSTDDLFKGKKVVCRGAGGIHADLSAKH